MPIHTLRELFIHTDWARDRLMKIAVAQNDDALDRPFEMGPGCLRETLKHIYGAERIWFERIGAPEHDRHPKSSGITRMDELWAATRDLADARNAWLATLPAESLARPITYRNLRGETWTNLLGDILLHTCNHATHHRAQCVNMIRRLGHKPPGLDYIFMRIEQSDRPAPKLEVAALRSYYDYGDWAFETVLDAAERLEDELLDRKFDIGLGSLRKTLLHIRDAEHWWLQNWTGTLPQLFDQLDAATPIHDLRDLFEQTAAARNAILAGMSDAHTLRQVSAQPSPGEMFTFSLGESMLQLCTHGTHHRAQALNMLRHVGATPPALDYVLWARSRAASGTSA